MGTGKSGRLAGVSCIAFIAMIANPRAQVSDTLMGVVTDSATASPLASAAVSAEGISTSTSSAGAFTLVLPGEISGIASQALASAPSLSPDRDGIVLTGYGDHADMILRDAFGRAAASFSSPGKSRAWRLSLGAVPMGIYFSTLRTASGEETFRLAKLPSGTEIFRFGKPAPASSMQAGRAGAQGSVDGRLSKAAASSKSHVVTFAKAGYLTDSIVVPAGTSTAPGISKKLSPDASGQIPAQALESVQVPAAGASVAFKTALTKGELYLLKAAGSVSLASGQTVDAEYGFAAGGAGADSLQGVDVGVDIGMQAIHLAKGAKPGRMKWFGAARTDHVYYLTVTGAGTPLSLKLIDGGTASGGYITVSLVRLSPTPPQLAKPLDSLLVPVTRVVTRSTLVTQASRVYLLQAAGYGKVGGNGTADGDADYMDWAADGAGKVDLGDQNTDYGLAVDELLTGAPNAYAPRLRWWGDWRKDHTYYMLFTGTGSTIAFAYIDVGYGDNSPTDKLTVKIFPMP